MSISLFLFRVFRKISKFFGRKAKMINPPFAQEYEFENRQRGSDTLLMILAGFQPYYWDLLFERTYSIVSQHNEPVDVCICIPCGEGGKDHLFSLGAKYGWSVLYIPDDLLAQAQNTAIKLHPKAEWIFKIDEDIVLCENYIGLMKAAFRKAETDHLYRVGYVSPLLNVNDFCSKLFLETNGLLDEYIEKFGEYKLDRDESSIFKDPEVAKWIWEKSLPFDIVAKNVFEKNRGKISQSPVRVRIGAIMMKRDFWEESGMFHVPAISELGTEEGILCGYCMNYFFKIIIAQDAFVGHLGFSKQKEACRLIFDHNHDKIKFSSNN